MDIDIFNQDWIISYNNTRGMYSLSKDHKRVLLSDNLESCESLISSHNNIEDNFVMKYHSVNNDMLIPDCIWINQ